MAWVLLDDNFPNHPKAVQAGPVAAYLYICGLCYCRRFHTKGAIPRKALGMLGLTTSPRRMVDALVDAGLWDVTSEGWQIHDYDGFYADEADKAQRDQELSDRTERRRAIRRESGRKGGFESGRIRVASPVASHVASSSEGSGLECSGDLVLKKKKREADFANFWAAYPKKDGKQAALKAWLKIDPDEDAQRQMGIDIDRRSHSAQWLKESGQFIPMASTYLNGRRWEDGFTERPRLSEQTISVIKGFEDVEDPS